MASIPPLAHFIWLGPRLSALAYLAVRSALDRGGFDAVVLHHDRPGLTDTPMARDLEAHGARLQLVAVAPLATRDASTADGLPGHVWDRLAALDGRGLSPATRSNLLRLELLWLDGGVYLDTDMVTLRSFRPLLADPGFAGIERICFPGETKRSRNPLRWARAGVLTALRAGISTLSPRPTRTFRRVERLYPVAANNAVLGVVPRHPLVRDLLLRAVSLDDVEAGRRYRMGTHLLQEVTGNRSRPDFRLHEPPAFFPAGPEVCVEYVADDPHGRLDGGVDSQTYAAHLYDSVLKLRTNRPMDAAYFAETRGQTPLARLVEPYLDDLIAVGIPEA